MCDNAGFQNGLEFADVFPRLLVLRQLTLLLKRSLANFTVEGSDISVCSQVVLHIAILIKVLITVRAKIELVVPFSFLVVDALCVVCSILTLNIIFLGVIAV